MVARSVFEVSGYTPADEPLIAASPDGNLVAVADASRIVVLELATGSMLVEIDPTADVVATEIGWLGMPPRLLVVSRHTAYSRIHLIDPRGPRLLTELRVEAPLRLAATMGVFGLALAPNNAVLFNAGDVHLTHHECLARTVPVAAGAGTREFYVALPAGTIEAWDPQERRAKRRLHLPRPLSISALGGNDSVAWATTLQDPARIDVIPLGNRAAPKLHDLPSPIGSLCGHARSTLLVCVAADRTQVHLVDLDGKLPTTALPIDPLDRVDAAELVVGRTTGVLLVQARRKLVWIGTDGRKLEAPGAAWRVPVAAVDTDDDEPAPKPSSLYGDPPPPPSRLTSALAPPLEPPSRAPVAPVASRATPSTPAPPLPPAPALLDTSFDWEPIVDEPAPRIDDDSAYPPVAMPRSRPAPSRVGARPPLAALAPLASPRRCSPGEYLTLLEHYRRAVFATASLAIARDWDSGRISFARQDRPPFEVEVLGITGRRTGLESQRVAEATEEFDEAARSLATARAGLEGRMSAIDVLCAEHGIDKTGELVLMLVAAPAIWGELMRLYAILANDNTRSIVDEQLLWQLLRDTVTRRDVARELDPGAPLLRSGLVRASDRTRPFQLLAVDPIAVKLLAGADLADYVMPDVEPVPATVPLDRMMLPRSVIDRGLADLAVASPGAGRIAVRGRAGSGRHTLLAGLAGLASRSLATIDVAVLVREKRLAVLPELLQHANLRGWLPCVDGVESIASDDSLTLGTVRQMLDEHLGSLAVRVPLHVHPPLAPGYVLIDLPTSTIAERAEQWGTALGAKGLTARDPDALAARFTVGAGTIHRVVDTISRDPTDDVDAAIETAMRQYLDAKLGAVATRVTRLASWPQIVLPSDIHDSIVELISRIRHRRKVYDTWGFDHVMTTSRGLTALFQGGPGTGKTLVAGAIARELGLDLYRIDLSRVMSKWIGETEQNLAKVFDAAEEGQAVILFDEADSLFTKRTEVRTSVDRYANLEVNYLLQRLDTFEGVAILTTNHGTAIDAAFKRRLSCRLTFPFPDDEARERLWQVHIPEQVPRHGKLDLAGLARRYKMSGGYIRNAALRAAFLAAEEDSPLTQQHLERAIRAEFREGGKLAESGVLE